VARLEPLGPAAEPLSVAGVTLVLTFLTLVLGELAPKRLAMQMALPWALAVARPLDVLSTVSRPVVAMLGGATNAVVRLFGGRPESEAEDISPEELRDLVTSHRDLNAEQREIISGALEIHERMLREVLVPRGSVVTIPAETTLTQARAAMATAGHSRIPVTRRHHLDDVVGIVHWGAVLQGGEDRVDTVATPAMVLPDTVRVSDALRHFKTERQQMALVIDEHGAVDGIVTLEDLLEEIVGEIWDETDRDVLGAERRPDGSLTLPGTFPVHDLEDVGVGLEPASGDYTTIAGLVLLHLGRVPEAPGDVVEVDGWRIEVLEVAHHAITKVLVGPGPAGGGDAG
jgi:putative hemolysin